MSFFRLCRHFPQCSAERILFFRIFIHVDHSCKMIGFLLLLLISCVIFFDIISSYLWFYSNFSEISFHCHLAILSRRPLSCLINQTVKYHSTSAFHLVSRGRNLPLQVFILWQENKFGFPHVPCKSLTGCPFSCITNELISFLASSLYSAFKYSPAPSSLLPDLFIECAGHCSGENWAGNTDLSGSWQKGSCEIKTRRGSVDPPLSWKSFYF